MLDEVKYPGARGGGGWLRGGDGDEGSLPDIHWLAIHIVRVPGFILASS